MLKQVSVYAENKKDVYKRQGLYKNAVQEESLEETVAEIRRQENFTSLEEMPETYVQAVVSVEDHRSVSYTHLLHE